MNWSFNRLQRTTHGDGVGGDDVGEMVFPLDLCSALRKTLAILCMKWEGEREDCLPLGIVAVDHPTAIIEA